MKIALGVAREAKGVEQIRFATADGLRDEIAHANHFVAVIGVCNDKTVLLHGVKNGKLSGVNAPMPPEGSVLKWGRVPEKRC